jgi:hypothetical protein
MSWACGVDRLSRGRVTSIGAWLGPGAQGQSRACGLRPTWAGAGIGQARAPGSVG